MSIRSRLDRLEKAIPKPREDVWPPEYRTPMNSFNRRSEAQQDLIAFIEKAMADPRATADQRASWQQAIEAILPALKWELESDRHCACPKCEYSAYDSTGDGLSKCRRCGCLVHIHGDGHVTDARPDVKGVAT